MSEVQENPRAIFDIPEITDDEIFKDYISTFAVEDLLADDFDEVTVTRIKTVGESDYRYATTWTRDGHCTISYVEILHGDLNKNAVYMIEDHDDLEAYEVFKAEFNED